MARRLGATEKQIEALLDLSGLGVAAVAGFPPECLGTAPTEPPDDAGESAGGPFGAFQRAALLFAERMTTGTGRVDDGTYAALREHFGADEVVEIAAVAGLFNYFNRFNNALEVEITR